MVITPVLHTGGRRFDPGLNHFLFTSFSECSEIVKCLCTDWSIFTFLNYEVGIPMARRQSMMPYRVGIVRWHHRCISVTSRRLKTCLQMSFNSSVRGIPLPHSSCG